MTRTRPHGRSALAAACGLILALAPAHAAQARIGDLDPSFDGDGVALPGIGPGAAQFEAVTTRPGGAPVAAGWAQTGAGEEAVVAQLTPAGSLDPGFGTGGITRISSTSSGFYTSLHDIALDGAGGVVGVGDRRPITPPPGQTMPAVLRLSPTGAPAPAVQLGATFGEARAVVPLPNETTLVAGWHEVVGAVNDVFLVARLDTSGELDQTFGVGGIAEANFGAGVDARALGMAVDPAGRIVLAGWAFIGGVTVPALARFDAGGSPDLTFGGSGRLTPPVTNPSGQSGGLLNDVHVDGAGRITAAGLSGQYALVLRLLADESFDPMFGTAGTAYGAVDEASELEGLVVDGDRAIVAGAAGPGRGPEQLLLGALDGGGTPEARLGGAPPGWRTFPVSSRSAALDVTLGPGGTVYSAGSLASPSVPYVSRHLPNAAPAAALASPDQVQAGAPATFDAAGSSDPEGEALSFAFDLDGDGSYEFDGGQNPLALRSFAAPGTFTVGVRVTDPRGAVATAARSIVVTAVAEPLPQPVLGRQGVAAPVRGIVRIRLPGTKNFVRLTELSAIPNGTEIDARKGRVLLTVLHDASGRLDGAEFYAGRFIFNQAKGKTPVTTLRLSGGSFAACKAKAKAKGARSLLAVAASVTGGAGSKSKKRVRKLWGDGRGKFRTKGRYGAATVRGTKWLTADRCDGTLVRVVRGKVSVDDLVRSNRRSKLVRAGARTLVAAKGGR